MILLNINCCVKNLNFMAFVEMRIHNWISSYLNNHSQVNIDVYSSGAQRITCGVPQGSVLHLKLFILYINDMCNVSKMVIFADDMNIFCSANDIKQLENMVCNKLYKLQLWFSINKLSLNIAKTNDMLFSGQKYTDIKSVSYEICSRAYRRIIKLERPHQSSKV